MSLIDELKKLTHPYEDEDEEFDITFELMQDTTLS